MKVDGTATDHNGQTAKHQSEQPDPFNEMVVQTRSQGMVPTRISVMVGDTVECIGPDGRKSWPKCEFRVEVECPQTEKYMEHAADHAHRVALNYTNNAMLRMVPDYQPMTF
jgi:hypothetical protein